MKNLFVPLLLLMASLLAIAQQPIDGPYVFDQGDSAQVITILQQEDLALPSARTITKRDLATQSLIVPVVSHQAWSFPLKLQKDLINPPSAYESCQKLYVLSDIEGEFAAGRQLLIAAKVIDEQYHWTFGKGHLVIAGDLFDRGTDVLPLAVVAVCIRSESEGSGWIRACDHGQP